MALDSGGHRAGPGDRLGDGTLGEVNVQPEELPHWHEPFKGFEGTIYCSGCDLAVQQPAGMPNYRGAGTGDW